jgi:lipopolysaccharide heptosyltransferase II
LTSRAQTKYHDLLKLPVRKILVIKLRAIGDVLLSTIVLDNLREAFPDAEIDFLTEPASEDVVIHHPSLNNVLVYNRKRDTILGFFLRLRARKYDLVFDLFCNPKSAQMTFATGAPLRVGYPFRGRAWAYNVKVKGLPESVHNTEFNLDALRHLEIPVIRKTVTFHLTDAERQWARNFLAQHRTDNGLLVALNPGCSFETKRWGSAHFADLADMLVERGGAEILLVWGPGEEEEVQSIMKRMKWKAITAPKTSLLQLGALLSECDYLVSGDTGPMHIAAAVDTPPLCIFGPTKPSGHRAFHPKSAVVRLESLECLECDLTTCTIGNMCMRDLPAETVFAAFEEMRHS